MASQITPASPLFLREAEIRRGIELLYFGQSHVNRAADAMLAEIGLGRAHHRVLYFVARRPGLTVGALLRLLAITKQSLGRVLGELTARRLVDSRPGDEDRRQRLLTLTGEGAALEARLFEAMRARMGAGYANAGQSAVTGFWQVLEGLIPVEDRGWIVDLSRER